MSFVDIGAGSILDAAASAVSLIGDVLAPYALIMTGSRSIGTIIPDIVVEEQHHDELIITDHPVETGAAISDHAFKMPSEVQMRCGFSDSTAQTEGYVQIVYQEFLDLQSAREPFDVSTGKRLYSNMLIRSIGITTDEKSEFALMATIDLREVIIVDTDTTGAAPASAMTDPQSTAPVVQAGNVNYEPGGSAPPLADVLSTYEPGGSVVSQAPT